MSVKNDLEKESKYAWWSALNHNGLLITSPKLIEFFPDEPKALSDWEIQKLRNYLDLLKLRDYQKLSEFIYFFKLHMMYIFMTFSFIYITKK